MCGKLFNTQELIMFLLLWVIGIMFTLGSSRVEIRWDALTKLDKAKFYGLILVAWPYVLGSYSTVNK